MSSITWHKRTKSYRGVLELPTGLDGKRRRKEFFGETKGEVKERMDAYKAPVTLSSHVASVADLADDFLAAKCRGEKPIAPTTAENYRYNINKLIKPLIGQILVAKLEKRHIEEWFDALRAGGWPRTDDEGKLRLDPKGEPLPERPKSTKARAAACTLLNGILEYGREQQILAHDPLKFVERPSPPEKDTGFLEKEEILRFLKTTCEEDQFPLLFFMLNTGMRIGEVLGLQWENVNFEKSRFEVRHTLMEKKRGTVTVGIPCGGRCGCGAVDGRRPVKTKKSFRTIDLTPDVTKALRRQQERLLELGLRACPWVFPSSVGTPQIQRNVGRLLERLLKKASIKKHVSLHGLRHSVATLLITEGAHPKIVQDLLGHADGSMMDRYVHPAKDHRAQVAEKLAEVYAGV